MQTPPPPFLQALANRGRLFGKRISVPGVSFENHQKPNSTIQIPLGAATTDQSQGGQPEVLQFNDARALGE